MWLTLLGLQGYFGCAIGKGKQQAKTEIEKLKLSELTCREAIKEVARMYVPCGPTKKKKWF